MAEMLNEEGRELKPAFRHEQFAIKSVTCGMPSDAEPGLSAVFAIKVRPPPHPPPRPTPTPTPTPTHPTPHTPRPPPPPPALLRPQHRRCTRLPPGAPPTSPACPLPPPPTPRSTPRSRWAR
jgi:hypothetical protein